MIVNVPVRLALPLRSDLVSPIDLVYKDGEIIGCQALEMNVEPWMH